MMPGEHLAYLKTNYADPGKLMPIIFGTTGVAMSVMFALIALGVPAVITTVVFVGLLLIGIYSFISTGEFWLYGDRLETKLVPKMGKYSMVKPKQDVYYWNELESYKLDSDTTRYGERMYLKLYFTGNRQVAIHEGNDPDVRPVFIKFTEQFTMLLDNPDKPVTQAEAMPIQQTAVPLLKPIKARPRKSFYGSASSKVLAWIFTVFSAALILVNYFPGEFGLTEMKPWNSWRLWAVILPGTLYFMGRAYYKPKK